MKISSYRITAIPGSIILLLGIFCIFTALGCGGDQGDNGDEPSGDGNGVGQVRQTDQGSEVAPGEAGGEEIDHGATAEGDTEVPQEDSDTTEDEFVPTEEQPLAPPAQPAAGVDDVEEGELALIASISGTGDPVPLREGVTIMVGDEMDLQVTLANRTAEQTVISFITSQKLDVFISDKDGNQVYQWSKNQRFAQVLSTLELAPGENWSHEITIPVGEGDNEVPPGIYDIAIILVGQPPLSYTLSDLVIAR